jgi:hypothetical protein
MVQKDKNETAVEGTLKNKNANKKVVQTRKLSAGKEYVNITEKLVPPNVFVYTPCNFALKCNKTLPEDK